MTKVGLYAISKPTTLESNKSLGGIPRNKRRALHAISGVCASSRVGRVEIVIAMSCSLYAAALVRL